MERRQQSGFEIVKYHGNGHLDIHIKAGDDEGVIPFVVSKNGKVLETVDGECRKIEGKDFEKALHELTKG